MFRKTGMSKFSTETSLSFIPENCRHLKNREEKSVRHVGSKVSGSQQTVVSQIYGRRDEKLTKFLVLNNPWFRKYMAEETKKLTYMTVHDCTQEQNVSP